MKCDYCENNAITYYKQIRKDGVIVVTARCENNHNPKKGQPFYSVKGFDLNKLDFLPDTIIPRNYTRQLSWGGQLRKDYEEENPIRKYPKLETPSPNGRNVLIHVEEE